MMPWACLMTVSELSCSLSLKHAEIFALGAFWFPSDLYRQHRLSVRPCSCLSDRPSLVTISSQRANRSSEHFKLIRCTPILTLAPWRRQGSRESCRRRPPRPHCSSPPRSCSPGIPPSVSLNKMVLLKMRIIFQSNSFPRLRANWLTRWIRHYVQLKKDFFFIFLVS